MKHSKYARFTAITATILAISLNLTACGGGNSGGSNDGNNDTNLAPTASAGTDLTVDEQSVVSLIGSGTDPDGTVSAYRWLQPSGTAATLSDSNSASSSYTSSQLDETE